MLHLAALIPIQGEWTPKTQMLMSLTPVLHAYLLTGPAQPELTNLLGAVLRRPSTSVALQEKAIEQLLVHVAVKHSTIPPLPVTQRGAPRSLAKVEGSQALLQLQEQRSNCPESRLRSLQPRLTALLQIGDV